jgi:hypothetical protein
MEDWQQMELEQSRDGGISIMFVTRCFSQFAHAYCSGTPSFFNHPCVLVAQLLLKTREA